MSFWNFFKDFLKDNSEEILKGTFEVAAVTAPIVATGIIGHLERKEEREEAKKMNSFEPVTVMDIPSSLDTLPPDLDALTVQQQNNIFEAINKLTKIIAMQQQQSVMQQQQLNQMQQQLNAIQQQQSYRNSTSYSNSVTQYDNSDYNKTHIDNINGAISAMLTTF